MCEYIYMDVLKKTLLLFLLVCVPLRVLFVVVAKMVSIKYLFYLGVLALGPAFGFLFLHFYCVICKSLSKYCWSSKIYRHVIM